MLRISVVILTVVVFGVSSALGAPVNRDPIARGTTLSPPVTQADQRYVSLAALPTPPQTGVNSHASRTVERSKPLPCTGTIGHTCRSEFLRATRPVPATPPDAAAEARAAEARRLAYAAFVAFSNPDKKSI
jgi:hypothetical protein